MKEKPQDVSCAPIMNDADQCPAASGNCPAQAKPLSKACGCERFKVCKVRGDRKMCARMAQMGVLPGTEIEVVCPLHAQNCMVRIKGSTVSLDQLSADNILVTPA